MKANILSARRTIVLAAAIAIAAAGCSSSSSSSSSSSPSSSSSSTSSSTATSSASTSAVSTSQCGTNPGVAATGTPIALGAIATNQPGTSFTAIQNMANAYFTCVNAH